MEDKWRQLSEQIPIPDSLKPEQIEKKLQQRQRQRQTANASRFVNYGVVAAVCLLLLVTAGTALYASRIAPGDGGADSGTGSLSASDESFFAGGMEGSPSDSSTSFEAQENSASGESSDSEPYKKMEHTTYEQLRDTISDYHADAASLSSGMAFDDIAKTKNAVGGATAKSAPSARSENSQSEQGTADAAGDYTKTDLQVEGVDEGDIVKTDGTYIYNCSQSTYGSQISIYLAAGADTKRVSKTTIEETSVSELYLEGDRLVALGSDWYNNKREYQTRILVYDISDAEHPKLISERSQSGEYYTSRKNGKYLYTLSQYSVLYSEKYKKKKSYVPTADGEVLPEDQLYLPEHTSSNCYLVLTALDITDSDAFTDTLSVLGAAGSHPYGFRTSGGSTCYVSEKHIYVGNRFYDDATKTTISKYRYENGRLEALTERTFRGTLNDQFSLDEYDGYLRFVATTYQKDGSTTNGLFVLDKNLEPVSSIEKLAKNERIYSARFMGTRAYFVTYRETDPVFLVDLSDPANPEVKDKLKIPGFSEYLHSYGDGLLLGIGSNELKNGRQQIKLSMFDISSGESVSEQNKKLLEKDTWSYAGENHKAVLVDPARNRIGLCVYSDRSDGKDGDGSRGCSYRIYSYDADGFHKVATLGPDGLEMTARGLFIGKFFYLVDGEGLSRGIRIYDADTFHEVR